MPNIIIIGFGNVSKEFISKLVNKFNPIRLLIITRINSINSRRIIESLGYIKERIMVLTKYSGYIRRKNIVVELIGDNLYSKDILLRTLSNNCTLVTANKNLLYKNINIIGRFLNKSIFFEASIGGGVQILDTLYFLKKVARIRSIYSILNGTTNYILSNIKKCNFSVKDVINLSKKKGISENDPVKDIKGYDSLNKITVLSNLVIRIDNNENIKSINMFGIEHINKLTITFLYLNRVHIRLISTFIRKKGVFNIETAPCILEIRDILSFNNFVYNTFVISTNTYGKFTLKARGAGPKVTSISVLRNVIKNKRVNIKNKEVSRNKYISGIRKTKILIVSSISIFTKNFNIASKVGIKYKLTYFKNKLIILISSKNCIFRIRKLFSLIGNVFPFFRLA
ncbi:hypothetical protein JSR06_00490 [Candidatus Vidania fulgoroideae]|uniref:homoserine dehydrogenase n=1 Tax=Candidatus Vidania fulgoroideorum TaxID=881286 RepID=A0A975AE48_9PROT|nr:hypothetical protein JSR06_00490 [Candidatus Vidania fulgoroideae]